MARISVNPNPKQTEWLKENFKQYRNKEIAAKFGITEWRLSVWLKQLDLKKFKRVYGGRIKVKKNQAKFEKPKISRPPAQYSNISREQHIDRFLNMNI